MQLWFCAAPNDAPKDASVRKQLSERILEMAIQSH